MSNENRKQPRRPEDHPVALIGHRATYGSAKIIDMSLTGARLKLLKQRSSLPDRFTMVLSYAPKITRDCQTVWQRNGEVGVKFVVSEASQARARLEQVLAEEKIAYDHDAADW